MKMVTKFNDFINENLLNKMKGKSEEELYNSLKDKPDKLLILGCQLRNIDIVKEAISKNANLYYKTYEAMCTALHNNDVEIVDCLLENGYDIKKISIENLIRNKKYSNEIIKTLIEYGVRN